MDSSARWLADSRRSPVPLPPAASLVRLPLGAARGLAASAGAALGAAATASGASLTMAAAAAMPRGGGAVVLPVSPARPPFAPLASPPAARSVAMTAARSAALVSGSAGSAVSAGGASARDAGSAAGAASAGMAGSRPAAAPWLALAARQLVLSRLAGLEGGELTIREAGGTRRLGLAAPDGLSAEIEVRDPRFWRSLVAGGSLGAAESYLAGWWDSRDLTALIRLMARNREINGRLDGGWARLTRAAARLRHARRSNTRAGSRRNSEAHYDLGNDFFALFLDSSMTYSAGFFAHPDVPLEEAQEAKLDRLCRKLQLSPADHLLEIGTGWGSLAIHAATRYGCRVTTATISPTQFREAQRRIDALGLGDRIAILQQDYRDLTGRFSRIVSVEMIEAVGHRYLPTFFAALDRLLRRDGLAAVQAITIADRNYESARRNVDFIQRYVFPGGALPSLTALLTAATRASSLTALHVEDLTLHYAETLRQWRQRFEAALAEVRRLGHDERFIRLWRYYLAYCEGGFRERVIGDAQILFAGAAFRGPIG